MKNICNEYGQFKCVECADAVWQECEALGLAAEYLKIDTPGERGNEKPLKLNWELYGTLTDVTLASWMKTDHIDRSVSEATLHYGVDVNGVVYDNVFPCGIARSAWENIFCSLLELNVGVVKSTGR